MDLTPFGTKQDEDRETKAAEFFARTLHDTWGVGMVTTHCGGTGLLVFLSVADRAIYISRGQALESIYTNPRLDRAMNHMKPFLQQGQVALALLHVLAELDDLLQRGPPDWQERVLDWVQQYMALLCFIGILSYNIGIPMLRQSRARQSYQRVTQQLEEIDRTRAKALQGKYRAESCPICLEPFQTKPRSTKQIRKQEQETLQATTSDKPQEEEEATERQYDAPNEEDEQQQQQTKAVKEHQEESGNENGEEKEGVDGEDHLDEASKKEEEDDDLVMIGPDGREVKLLRCGHVFNQTCWEKWIQSGQGPINKCPICKQDIGEDGSLAAPMEPRSTFSWPTRQSVSTSRMGGSSTSTGSSSTFGRQWNRDGSDGTASSFRPYRHRQEMSTLHRYNYERQFRLERLNRRYPQYVNTQLMQRWAQSTYDGSLARDPSFVQSNPSLVLSRNHYGNNSSGSGRSRYGRPSSNRSSSGGFGGGGSGGGRGTRW